MKNNAKYDESEENDPPVIQDTVDTQYIDNLEKKIRLQASRLQKSVPVDKYEVLQNQFAKLMKEYNSMKNKKVEERDRVANSSDKKTKSHSSYGSNSLPPKGKKTKPEPEEEEEFYEIEDFLQDKYIEKMQYMSLDKLKRTHVQLLIIFKDQLEQKEELLEMLRRETINNEEQRNLIEVLKETLESEILKSGFGKYFHNTDSFIDFNKLKFESEKYRKELVMANVIITDLKNENEELKSRLDKIKHSLDNGIEDMEMARNKVRNLEYQRDSLEEEVTNLKIKVNGLQFENEKIIKKINEKKENTKDNSSHNSEILTTRINEYKVNFDKLNDDFEKIVKEKTKLEIENAKVKEELNNFKKKLELNDIKLKQSVEFHNSNNSSNNENIMYRKLYEEVNTEFDEYKALMESRIKKQISNDKTIKEELLKECNKLSIENNLLRREAQKNEIDIKKLKDDLFEAINNNEKSLNQKDSNVKENYKLQNEIANLKNEIEKITKEALFSKEKNEKEINLKSKELAETYEELNNVKIELKELKENLKELKKNLNKKEEECEELSNNLMKSYNVISEKELDLKKSYEQGNNSIAKKYENLLNDLEEYAREIKILSKKVEEGKIEKNNYEDSITNHQNKIMEAEREINFYINEVEKFKMINNNLIEENENLKYNLNQQNGIMKNLQFNLQETEKLYNQLINEKNDLEEKYNFNAKGLTERKKENEELVETNKNIQNFSTEVKIQLYSLYSLLKVHIHKFHSIANEDLDSLLTQNFSQNISKISSLINQFDIANDNNLNNLLSIFTINSDYLKILCNEFDNIYEKLIDSNNYIKESKNKIMSLENSLNEINHAQDMYLEKEKKLKNNIKSITDEKYEIQNFNKKLEEFKEQLNREIELYKKERENCLVEIKTLKSENYNLNLYKEKYNKLNEDFHNKNLEFDKLKIRAENKVDLLTKEKKLLESLLTNFVKSYPCKEINKLMNEILNINDFIMKTENEKMKIEEKLIQMESEFNQIFKDNNNDLCLIVKNEKDNLKRLIIEFERRTSK